MTLVQVRRLQAHIIHCGSRVACGLLQFSDEWTDLLAHVFCACSHQAKESGFAFGAYSHCSWPENKDGGRVADLTGQSFLFSLTNAADQAVRFSLSNKNDAIGLESSGGVHFGLNGINFVLNFDGAASDSDRGNTVFPLDEFSAYQPDDKDFLCGVDFFAGSEYFTAADIEVYER